MVRCLILFVLLLHPIAAYAGVRAIYTSEQQGSTEILIADNGDASATFWENRRLIVHGDQAYIVQQRLTGPIVTRLDDLVAVVRARLVPKNIAAGPQPSFVSRGTQAVNGRAGEAFGRADVPAGRPDPVVAILSHDPTLAAIGRAFRQVQIAEIQLGQVDYGWTADANPEQEALIRLLAQGTALKEYDTNLFRIEPAEIAPDLVALPAPPETSEALAARLARESSDAKVDDRTMISRAIFADRRLWLLTDTGKLSSLVEGADRRETCDPGGKVLDICAGEQGLLAVTDDGREARSWTLKRWREGHWQPERRIGSNGERVIALSCDASRPILLTSRRLIGLDGHAAHDVPLSESLPAGRMKTAVHVAGDHIYVGIDAGEWGGGLRRIDRRTGKVANVERVEGGGACGRPLDSKCDPVDAVATIPWKPDCVAVAVGLIHFDSSGRIVSICDDKVDLLFAQPHDLYQQDRAKAAEAAEGGFGSVAFFGLTASGNTLVAAGDDGLYRIGPDRHATHQQWPLFKDMDGVLVSFALPDLILVMTEVNRRVSVSGISPLLVVR
ncbi:MAG TPA: hypothetical protein VGF77_00690 [Allosphingosinicella sp.]